MNDADNAKYFKYRKKFFIAEFFGTAILLLLGLSVVIFMFGEGTPMAELIPNIKMRQIITGFLFGSVGAGVALSPLGKISGAHINPAVTMVFWLYGKIKARLMVTYVFAQLAGGIVGCIPLLLWGYMGKSIDFAATVPGADYTVFQAYLGEVITTFFLVILLIVFIGFREIRRFTPFMIPILYAIMVPLEADVSGVSTNPARSLGPAVIAWQWDVWWIYWIGPLTGALIASLAGIALAKRITIAKLYHFDSENEVDSLLSRKKDPLIKKLMGKKGPKN